MVRYLAVMRHAKSAWPAGVTDDHVRPLNARGRRDAPRIADALVELGWTPQLVLSSDSARTQETWARMADRLPETEVVFTRLLYHAGVDTLVRALAQAPDACTQMMVLGHNPGWEDAVAWLTGSSVRMTTANVALMTGEGPTWADALQPRAWTLSTILRPKELP